MPKRIFYCILPLPDLQFCTVARLNYNFLQRRAYTLFHAAPCSCSRTCISSNKSRQPSIAIVTALSVYTGHETVTRRLCFRPSLSATTCICKHNSALGAVLQDAYTWQVRVHYTVISCTHQVHYFCSTKVAC